MAASRASIRPTISQNRVRIGSYFEVDLQYASPPRVSARTGPEKEERPRLNAAKRKPAVRKRQVEDHAVHSFEASSLIFDAKRGFRVQDAINSYIIIKDVK